MIKRFAELAANRQRLLEKIESQRMEMAAIAERWQTPLTLAEKGLWVLHFLRDHPVLISGGVAAVRAYRRKGAAAMVGECWRFLKQHVSPFSFVLNFIFPAAHAQGDEGKAR